jgi:thiol-disulfide isomerase/thioredoxin
VGRAAPPLIGATLDGNRIDLAAAGAGRLTWVNFWATSCEPCRAEMPAMQALAERYADELLVLGVNWGEDTDSVGDFVGRYEVRYPIVMDPTLDTFYAWNPSDGLPRHFFVDGEGTVVREVIGPVPPDEMLAIIEDLLGAA